jgi:hypothetical protein
LHTGKITDRKLTLPSSQSESNIKSRLLFHIANTVNYFMQITLEQFHQIFWELRLWTTICKATFLFINWGRVNEVQSSTDTHAHPFQTTHIKLEISQKKMSHFHHTCTHPSMHMWACAHAELQSLMAVLKLCSTVLD